MVLEIMFCGISRINSSYIISSFFCIFIYDRETKS